jgi:FdrA protein
MAIVVGTDEDPQDLSAQIEQLESAGAQVETSNDLAVRRVGRLLRRLNPSPRLQQSAPVDLAALQQPLAAINAGLESFAESVVAQSAEAIQVDWRPPAAGNERLMAILERMKGG